MELIPCESNNYKVTHVDLVSKGQVRSIAKWKRKKNRYMQISTFNRNSCYIIIIIKYIEQFDCRRDIDE